MSDTTDPWGGDVPDVKVRELTPAPALDPEQGRLAWTEAVTCLGDLLQAARLLGTVAEAGARSRLEALDGGSVVTMVAALQDVRRDLAQVEATLVREVGRDEATLKVGVLPDGRRYEVRKGATRKAWDHDAWKRDVREQALAREDVKPGDLLVNAGTGEPVQVSVILRAVQEAHGAGAPRATALRGLGLDPDDYCQSVPGSWSVTVSGETSE